jgi:hypothetical protein
VSLLHITNGSAIIPLMREAGIADRIVPWDDVLHEGPVPAGLNPAALRDTRVDFLATWGGPSRDAIARRFAERDAALEHLHGDQLQLIQILERVSSDHAPPVMAVPDNDYLGHQSAAQFAGLFASRHAITSAQRVAARDAWHAFRSPDPRTIVDCLPRVTALRHLAPALRRHLQQFPAPDTGLSRTEQQTLEALAHGVTRVKDVFVAANHDREEAVFMGDAGFVSHIMPLIQGPRPLIRVRPRDVNASPRVAPPPTSSFHRAITRDDDIEITDDGRAVLAGQADRIKLCGIDRWLGGVHLTGHGAVWRYDASTHTLRVA